MGQMANKYFDFLADQEVDMQDVVHLELEDLVKVCTRNIPSEQDDPDEHKRLMAIFVFVWDKFLPAIAGRWTWRPSIRHNNTISEARVPGQDDVVALTVNTEAFVLLAFANCIKRWKEIWILTNGKTVKKKIPKKKTDAKTKDFQGLWSNPHCGNAPFGGWKAAGLKQFKTFCDQVRDGRKKEECGALEAECLRLVREKNNLAHGVRQENDEEEDDELEELEELEFDD